MGTTPLFSLDVFISTFTQVYIISHTLFIVPNTNESFMKSNYLFLYFFVFMIIHLLFMQLWKSWKNIVEINVSIKI